MAETAVAVTIEPQQALAPASESTALISMIERAARDPNVDIEKFERLMLMKERVERQSAFRAFNAAVSSAKGEFPPIGKNRVVDFTSQKGRTNYKHEDLAEIAAAVDPVLKKHGLSYRHRSAQNGQKLSVTCILSHSDGHFEETTLEASEDHSGNKNSIQAIGSAATYLQRYTLKIALGLASSHDDDGGKAAGSGAVVSDEQVTALRDMIGKTSTDINRFLEVAKAESLSDVLAKDFTRLMAFLVKKAGTK
jgi:hypothetical protein